MYLVFSEDAKKEDLVHNVFDVTARNHVSSVAACCRMTGATEVFFCGNVFNSEIMREMTLTHRMLVESYLPPVIMIYIIVIMKIKLITVQSVWWTTVIEHGMKLNTRKGGSWQSSDIPLMSH